MSQLTLEEKVDIIHRIFILADSHSNIAKAFRVKIHLVGSLKKKILANGNYIRDQRQK